SGLLRQLHLHRPRDPVLSERGSPGGKNHAESDHWFHLEPSPNRTEYTVCSSEVNKRLNVGIDRRAESEDPKLGLVRFSKGERPAAPSQLMDTWGSRARMSPESLGRLVP